MQHEDICRLILEHAGPRAPQLPALRATCAALRQAIDGVVSSVVVREDTADQLLASGLLRRLPALNAVEYCFRTQPLPLAEVLYALPPAAVSHFDLLQEASAVYATPPSPRFAAIMQLRFSQLSSFCWEGGRLEPDDLFILGHMTQLRELNLRNLNRLSDAKVGALRRLVNLRTLRFYFDDVHDVPMPVVPWADLLLSPPPPPPTTQPSAANGSGMSGMSGGSMNSGGGGSGAVFGGGSDAESVGGSSRGLQQLEAVTIDAGSISAVLMLGTHPRLRSATVLMHADPLVAGHVDPALLPGATFPALYDLDLDLFDVRDADAPKLLQALARMPALRRLGMSAYKAAACFAAVAHLRQLEDLSLQLLAPLGDGDLTAAPFNNSLIVSLSAALVNLTSLTIKTRQYHLVTDAGMLLAARNMRRLCSVCVQELHLGDRHRQRITAAAALAFAANPSVRRVAFGGGSISEQELLEGAALLQRPDCRVEYAGEL